MKKMTSLLLAMLMLCGSLTGCGEDTSESVSTAESSAASESSQTEAATKSTETAAATEAETTVDFEQAVEAESGDAYLAIVDGQWYVQYWGSKSDLLTYDAGVVKIDGDGDYTVSVNGATKGMIFDVTGVANGRYTPSGMSFMAVIVKDGTKLYPNMSIDVKEVRVNGEALPLNGKSYTSSDDAVEMRSNIYNEWVNELPKDAHDANGSVTDADVYTPQLVDKEQFGEWTSVEVDFTVSGIS